jgi:predicted esterase
VGAVEDNKIKVPMTLRKHWWKFVLLIAAVIMLGTWAYVLVAVRGTFASFQPTTEARGVAVVAGVAGHRIVGRVYVNETSVSLSAPLVIVLHGDAPFINPGYQYAVAADLAGAVPGGRVVALMRPGYADVYGSRSDGDRGFATGENYTLSVANDLAAAIQSLKQQWGAPSIILVGHSGGAAVAANIAALFPGLVQHLFLVACPCDVPAFRQHMARLQWSPMWLLPVDSLSPIQTLARMNSETKITAISGANDPIALVEYSEKYIAKARTLGIAASMIILPDKGHEILDDTAVIALVSRAARNGN